MRTGVLVRGLLLFLEMVVVVLGQQRVWTKLAGTTTDDGGYGVAVDQSSGAVYVAGSASLDLHGETNQGSDDILLIKYTSGGSRSWTRMVGTSGGDVGNGVSIDSSTGDVYVAGYAASSLHGQSSAGSTDVALIRFASNGTRVWTRLFGSSAWDQANAVSVNANSTLA
eukprot:gene33875-40986_t